MTPLPECCATCLSCGLSWCRDETPSPGEVEGLCPDCWDTDQRRSRHMTITERLERRYHVEKLNDTAGKHTDCQFFVLDPQHDAFAVPALRAYADAVGGELASDIRAWLRSLDYCPRCSQVRGHRGVCG